jgi:enoyl-CoA hydratase/carnithine racemase
MADDAAAAKQTIEVAIHERYWEIALARPEKLNAFNVAMRDELWTTLQAARLAGVRVALRGIGRAFCAGGDLTEFGLSQDTAEPCSIRQARGVGWLIHQLRDRTVVAVHGAFYGAGIEMAAFAGTVIADPTARFSLPETRFGLIPGAGGTVSVPRRIGRRRALELVMTGRIVEPDEALSIGLIDEIVPSEQLIDRLHALAGGAEIADSAG